MERKIHYEGRLEKMDSKKIYLNIDQLEKGNYKLNIIHNKKIIKTTLFIKD